MFCPFCGVKNKDDVRECFVCGKKMPWLESDAPKGASPAARPRSSSVPRSTLATAPAAARLGDRLIALVLDTIFIVALLFPAAAAIAVNWSTIERTNLGSTVLIGIAGLCVVVVIFLYHWVQEGAFGATVGKAMVGIRVVRRDTSALAGFKSSAIRNALRLVDGVPLYFPGFFVAIFSSRRQRLGDYAARTVVQERQIDLGGRITVVLIWLAVVAGSVWATHAINPAWFKWMGW